MSQWSHNHPEEMAEIARLPASQQNAALRDAIGYDPDRIRDEQKERPTEVWLTCPKRTCPRREPTFVPSMHRYVSLAHVWKGIPGEPCEHCGTEGEAL